jgi:hypothetical protein
MSSIHDIGIDDGRYVVFPRAGVNGARRKLREIAVNGRHLTRASMAADPPVG